MTDGDVFKHSTPDLYDRYMVPLLFEPFARMVADRVAALQPGRILETAAGTGILTALAAEAAPEAEIVATDINPGVVVRRHEVRHEPRHRSAGRCPAAAVRRGELRLGALSVRRDVLF